MDERVLGPGTTVRFALLLVLLVVASVAPASDFASRTTESHSWACALAAGWDPDGGDLAEMAGLLSQPGPYESCLARHAPRPPWWLPLLGPVVLVAAATALFFAIAAWKARRVVPVRRVDRDGDLTRVLDDLVATAGLTRAPAFVVDPTATSTGAVVFGRDGRPVVSLHGGLLVRRHTDPARFRAVVLHELAHVRNRDITLTYATVALWRVFLALVLLPDTVWLVWQLVEGGSSPLRSSYLPSVTRGIVLAVVLVLLVHLARADVLRTREVHADLTALRWGADRRGWEVADTPSVGGAFAELWRTHPRWDLRRASLDDPAPLFGVRALPMFLTGVGAALIYGSAWQYLKHYRIAGWWADQVVALLASALVTGIAGIVLWRAVAHARLTNVDGPTGVRAGLWLGTGVLAGELVGGQNVIHSWVPARWWFLSLIVVAGVAFTWWIAQCARLWAGTWPGRTLRAPMLLVLAAGWVVLSAWFAWWRGGGALLVVGWPIDTDAMVAQFQRISPGTGPAWLVRDIAVAMPMVATVSKVPLLLVAVTLAWAVPLLAWTVRPGPLRWVREAVADAPEQLPQPLPPLRRVVLPGVLGGALAAVALLVGRDLPELEFVAATFVAATAAALLAALVAPSRHRLPVVLAAAQIAALCAIAVGALVRSWSVLSPMITPALALAAVLAVGIAVGRAAARRLRRRRSALSVSPPPHRVVPVRPRRAVVAVLATGSLLTAGVEITADAARPSGSLVPGPTPTASASSARVTRMQLAAWSAVGGHAILARVTSGTTCDAAATAARDAQAFFRVPDPRLRPLWNTVVTRSDRARTHCPTKPEIGLAWARAAAVAATALRAGLAAVHRGEDPVTTVPEPGDALGLAQWADQGARDLLSRFGTTSRRLFAYIDQVQGRIEPTTLTSHCAEVSRVGQDAQGFFRVSDPGVQERWDAFVKSSNEAGSRCTRSIADVDVAALRTALQEIQRLRRVAVCLENRIRGSVDSC
ncbi:M48 family metalloprotease [Streptoalloteichus hindustanus]|uniref:M48 family metalloprotease n=1 Tax=Streptoalloteichus hindustanus TaxID=2017 RepID=UPI001160E792|nr:M48 family metalloprotease [Streptoalloteichus hindustanus]